MRYWLGIVFSILSCVCLAESISTTLYLLGYDVPIAQRQQMLENDIAILRADIEARKKFSFLHLMQGKDELPAPLFQRDTFPRIDLTTLTLCSTTEPCFSTIAQEPQTYRESLEILAPVLADIERLQNATPEALISPFRSNLASPYIPLVNYQYLFRPLITHNALALHDTPKQGLKSLCASITLGKNLIRSQSHLIQSMIGAQLINSQLNLLTDYQSVHSSPLPQDCLSALQPLDNPVISLCPLIWCMKNN